MNATVVTLTYPDILDEDALVRIDQELEYLGRDGSVAAIPGRGTTLTLWNDDAHDFDKALHVALEVGDNLRTFGPPVSAEILTEDEYVRRAEEPTLPHLMSAPEVADLLDVTRQRVHQLRSLAAFPAPLVELRTGPIWDAAAVEKFAREWTRKPGRPAKKV